MPNYLTSAGTVNFFEANRLKDNPLNKLTEASQEFTKRLESLLYFTDIIEAKNLIFAESALETIEYLEDKSFDIVLAEALKAILSTREYNYPMYIDNFLEALNSHKNEIISLTTVGDDRLSISANFESLGTIFDWENAVTFARTDLHIGKGEDSEKASRYWAFRIYGVAREGIQVITYTKKGGKKDITESFKGLYPRTIEKRLSHVEEGQAPYWYLIENGNAPGTMQDKGGVAYPMVAPTRFVAKIEIALVKIADIVLNRFVTKTLNEYAYALLESVQKGAGTATVEEIQDIFRIASQLVQEQLSKEYPEVSDANPAGAQMRINLGDLRLVTFNNRGKRQSAFQSRKTGQFVTPPIKRTKLKKH